jgi:diguanylate cyclase (GGDEF)-like protein/PAS domain S-box-containing protein
MAATTSGVAIADMRLPDQPLVYVNEAFERLAGLPREEVLGRNCRFLQSPDTDPSATARIRAALSRGEVCRETVLNVRGPDRDPWWNEVHLVPVRDADGTVVRYIGVQHDVTARVEAERALQEERDRSRAHEFRIAELAHTDPLTGLPGRGRLAEQLETAIWTARAGEDTLAVLSLDLDGLSTVNETLGHAAGDELLTAISGRLRGRLRRGDLLARLGGDRFLVALTGLDPETATAEARRIAQDLSTAAGRPVALRGREVPVAIVAGVAVYPVDGEDFDTLLHSADLNLSLRRSGAPVRR